MTDSVAEKNVDITRRASLGALIVGILAIAAGYAAALLPRGTPAWAPWLLALGIPIALGAIMILGSIAIVNLNLDAIFKRPPSTLAKAQQNPIE